MTFIVFENDTERSMMCAGVCHDWDNQPQLFGSETEKILKTAKKLFNASIHGETNEIDHLLRVLNGIAKRHHLYITWYGNSSSACEPDRFLISGNGHERLGFIQC